VQRAVRHQRELLGGGRRHQAAAGGQVPRLVTVQ
jgi:hypothetical protein